MTDSTHASANAVATGEIRRLLLLAAPLIVNNLAIAGMGLADTIMAGRGLGAEALAAVAVGSSTWFLFFFVAMGILTAISPIGARYIGADQPRMLGRFLRQGWYLSVVISAGIMAALWFGSAPALEWIGIDSAFRQMTVDYLRAILWGAPGVCFYLCLRYTTEATGFTVPIMFVTIGSLVVNVFGNWVFMFGNLGAPAMGAAGAGVASAITMWAMLVMLLGYMLRSRRYTQFELFAATRGPSWPELREIIVIGVPIMVSIVAEAGLFSAISMLMGRLSANVAAAHQVAMNYATFTFMVPLGLNGATTILVGQAIGRGDLALARARGVRGIVLCGAFMTLSALVLLLFRDGIVGLYTDDPSVVAVALTLLLVAGVFQISDGLQVGASGALRGMQDTQVPMWLTTIAYWCIGFPLAYVAAFVLDAPPAIIWCGLVVGLSCAAVALILRFRWVSQSMHRIRAARPDKVS